MDQQDIAALETLAGLELDATEREALRGDLQAMVRLAEELKSATSAEVALDDATTPATPGTAVPVAADPALIQSNLPRWQDPYIDVPAPSRDEDESTP